VAKTETVTLHFDLTHLSHLGAEPVFTLKARGKRVVLKRHDDETRDAHAARNGAVGAMSTSQRRRLTHFAEDVELSGDALRRHTVEYPSRRPDAVTDDVAAVFYHVPSSEVRRAVQAMRRDADVRVPAKLHHFGVRELAETDVEDMHVNASLVVSPLDTALSIVVQHPEIGTIIPATHMRIAEQVVLKASQFADVWQYISTHPDDWMNNTHVKDLDGNVMPPSNALTDKNGEAVVWPTITVEGKQVSVIPQHDLADGLLDATRPAVLQILKVLKQQSWLKGQHWATQHGVTVKERSESAAPKIAPLIATASPQADWTSTNLTSMYGLDIVSGPDFDVDAKTLSIEVRNWPNRGLGAYARFLDSTGKAIGDPQYQQVVSSGNTVFGIPVWAGTKTISVTVPDEAAGVDFLFGGLGHGDRIGVEKEGIIYTSVLCYGMPAVFIALSTGAQTTQWYKNIFKDKDKVALLVAAGVVVLGPLIGIGSATIGVGTTLMKVASTVAGIIFKPGLEALATAFSTYTTSEELVQAVPIVGQAIKIASLAASAADMIATSVEVGLSPAYYVVEAKRSMALSVTIMPDPTHGTSTQHAVWPKSSDHYVVTVQYKGGTAIRKAGPMPGKSDAPIALLFSNATGDALPVAPAEEFQILANIYSESNWLCGKWTTGWLPATPTDGDRRSESFSIIEQLVPLSSATQYEHLEVLDYDGPSSKYVWEKTRFSIDDGLEAQLAPGVVSDDVKAAFLSNGVRLSGGSSVSADSTAWRIQDAATNVTFSLTKQTITSDANGPPAYELAVRNVTHPAPQATVAALESHDVCGLVDATINQQAYKLGYAYYAKNQNLPLDDGSANVATAAYVFRSISTLADPAAGSKSPTRAFSMQPYIAYDQFGPAPLLSLDPASAFATALDAGGAAPADVIARFGEARVALPKDAAVTVVTGGAAWRLGEPGQTPLYDLRRQVDSIKVFRYPVAEFSPRNFYLDTRTYEKQRLFQLRQVDLRDDSGPTFDYDSGLSWGSFNVPDLNAIVVHPNGYVIGVSYQHDKMALLELPEAPVKDADAPQALLFSGAGLREGLMQGPVAMTVTADGRILVLEQSNGRIQAFDTQGNPVQCFAAELAFDLDAALQGDMDTATASHELIAAMQRCVPVQNIAPGAADPRFLLTPLFSMPMSAKDALNTNTLTADVRDLFKQHGFDLGDVVNVTTTAPGLWLIADADGMTYDVRADGEKHGSIDVYRGFSPTIEIVSRGAEWLLRDRTNTLTFRIRKPTGQTALSAQRQGALMALKDPPGSAVVYLDMAVETKGFIYVLSYVKPGDDPSDYRLDIYNPDGTPLTPGVTAHNGHVTGARMALDQWRTLFTLDYEEMEGPGGRPEPTVSQWIATDAPSASASIVRQARRLRADVSPLTADNAFQLSAGELPALRGLLVFQAGWGPGAKQLSTADVTGFFDSFAGLYSVCPQITNPTIVAWLDPFVSATLTTNTVYQQPFTALYIAYALLKGSSTFFSWWWPVYGNTPVTADWPGMWNVFLRGYGGGWWWGDPDAQGEFQYPWRPTYGTWQATTEAFLTQWGETPPNNILSVAVSPPDTAAFQSRVLAGWSDFPTGVGSALATLWTAQTATLTSLMQTPSLSADAYFFLLHLLIALPTGDDAAQDLAWNIVNTTANSPEYPHDTFATQLVYAALLNLADPLGNWALNHDQLQGALSDMQGAIVSGDPASTALKTSLQQHLKVLSVDSGYPVQDGYSAVYVAFNQRKTDTLAALDAARKTALS
jgi:hypothetical protein